MSSSVLLETQMDHNAYCSYLKLKSNGKETLSARPRPLHDALVAKTQA